MHLFVNIINAVSITMGGFKNKWLIFSDFSIRNIVDVVLFDVIYFYLKQRW